ncbi:cytochrome P450 [Gallibacterium sp. AGMB14963]|uniref:cytochrome P450 n=1 Tax=Gallibacterium faecale TaxID=3019086 RepID=UPI0022F18BC3|nr:cytochrome P450 [Gallibacterium sp. AGMB14963]MDA3979810.1 cytochrome P450 [Gallibacterium sp. AGMB14963]
MCDINLKEVYKERYRYISSKDNECNGFYYDKNKMLWVFYSYSSCIELLNNSELSKNRMDVPLDLFSDKEKDIVINFIELINLSLIFRDHKKGPIVKIIHDNYKNIDAYSIIADLLSEKKVITEVELTNLNNILAGSVVGLNNDAYLSERAINVGMLFDGRVNGKKHFLSIAKSFLELFDYFKKSFNDSDENISDMVVTYIAAHQTTMQLIVATLYTIHNFNLTVDKSNIKNIILESSRLYSPVLSVGRIVTKDIHYCRNIIKKGERAIFYTGLANFDSNSFVLPFTFNLDRINKPLSFGVGIHKCIGMGISLDFTKIFVEFILEKYKLKNVSIFKVDDGASAIGISSFTIEINKK